MDESLANNLKRLPDLVAPVETWNPTSETPAKWLNDILRTKVKLLDSHLNTECDKAGINLCKSEEGSVDCEQLDVRWVYVTLCLAYLNKLKNLLLQEAANSSHKDNFKSNSLSTTLPPDALSVSQQQHLSHLLQLTIVLGSVPSLLPGVGLPVERRTKFYPILEEYNKSSGSHLYGESEAEVAEEKYRRLVYVTNNLLKLLSHDGLAEIILTRHIGDLTASLIQLGYAPLIKPNETKNNPNEKLADSTYVMTSERYETLKRDQHHFRNELDKLLARMYQPSVIKSLLILQSSGATETARTTPLPKSINVGPRPRTPKWLQHACGGLLSKQLTDHPSGVSNVIRGVLDVGCDVRNPEEGKYVRIYEMYEVIANVIGNPPASVGKYANFEDYFALICPQLLHILSTLVEKPDKPVGAEAEENAKIYRIIACACIKKLSERSVELSKRYILDLLMEPLLRMCNKNVETPNDETLTILSEKELDEYIGQLHFLFVIGNDPSSTFIELLCPVIPTLLFIHCKICSGISHIRSLVQQLVERFLIHVPSELAIKVLRAFVFSELVIPSDTDGNKDDVKLLVTNQEILIRLGEEGGIKAVIEKKSPTLPPESVADFANWTREMDLHSDDDITAAAIVDLINCSKCIDLTKEFYLNIMKELTTMISETGQSEQDAIWRREYSRLKEQHNHNKNIKFDLMDESSAKENDEASNPLMKHENKLKELHKNFMVLRLLLLMSAEEKIQDALMHDPTKMIELLLSTINRATVLCKSSKVRWKKLEKSMSGSFYTERPLNTTDHKSLEIAFALLTQHILGNNPEETKLPLHIKESDWELLKSGVQDLKFIEKNYDDRRLRKTALDLITIIKTRGAVKKYRSPFEEFMEKERNLELKAEGSDPSETRTSDGNSTEEVAASTSKSQADSNQSEVMKVVKDKTEYAKAVEDMEDLQVPVRGHGLISLTNLVLSKETETMKNIDKVIDIFKENLKDNDTYVYLQSVKGLAACASRNTHLVITTLTQEYDLIDDSMMPEEKALELRTKLGEALVKITCITGELTVIHMNALLNPFLNQLKNNPMPHPDPMIRASSLSNIGSICKNLRFAIGPIVHEIIDCLINVLRCEQSAEVQRAGVHVFTMILQGLGSTGSIRLLGKEGLLRDIHRTLKSMKNNPDINDEVTRQHISMALEEVDKIAREFLFPSSSNAQQMSKTIYVLDAPPNLF